MSNWRPFTLDFGTPAHACTNGRTAENATLLQDILASVSLCDTSIEVLAERRAALKRAGCDVSQLKSMRARTALLEGAVPSEGSWRLAPTPAHLLRMLICDLLRSEVAPNVVAEVLRNSACAHLVGGGWETIGPLVERCQRDLAHEAAEETWRDPPTDGGTDAMVTCALVALTRERGAWSVSPASAAIGEIVGWIESQGYPVPADLPQTGRSLGFTLRRIKRQLTLEGVRLHRGRIGGKESNGLRPRIYRFSLWGRGGAQGQGNDRAA